MSRKSNVVTVRLTDEQLKFFTDWQQKLESDLAIEVPLGAIIRRALDGVIHQHGLRQSNDTQSALNESADVDRVNRVSEFVDGYKKEESE